jgi:hypothetical protein
LLSILNCSVLPSSWFDPFAAAISDNFIALPLLVIEIRYAVGRMGITNHHQGKQK